MATSLSRSFRLSSTLKIDEEAMVITKNQGISSILTATDCERSVKSSSSLRRALSADTSSTKWLTTQMKKTAASEEYSVSSINQSLSSSYEEEDDDDEERKEQSDDSKTEPQSQFDIWSSIQKEVYEKKELEKPGQFDIWSSIISQKEQENNNSSNNNKSSPPPLPYIHPLVRRSASSLSEKSLEICTESLGSETGSDGFSSSETETGDAEDDKEMEQEQQQLHERVAAAPSFDFEQLQLPKYSYVVSKRSPQRSFPPPIPSLSRQDGASIRVQTRRDNGRLVLEAVSVPSANNFRALRQDGRLVLTFINSYATELSQNEEPDVLEEEIENLDDEEEERESEAEEEEIEEEEEEEEAEEKEIEFVMEQAPKFTSVFMNVHRLTLVGFAHRDPRWPKNFNEEEGVHIKSTTIVAQSLPAPPRMARLIPKSPGTRAAATGASFNAYWRPKPMSGQNKGKNNTNINDYNTNKLILSKKSMGNRHEQQQLLVLRGNEEDYLVPLLKSCKEPRRSLMDWEPCCPAIV